MVRYFKMGFKILFLCSLIFSGFLQAQIESRPVYNTGTGFFVKDGKLYDANGMEFILYGANSVHVWLNDANAKNALRYEMPKARINTARLVTAGESWTWNNQSETPAKKKAIAQLAIDAYIVPMLELHDGTCLSEIDRPAADGKMGLKQIVDHWLLPDNVAMLNDLEKYLMLNIANEWGPDMDAANSEDFLLGYKDAITRLRNAGIKNLLVIDAGGCGQDPRTLFNYADQLLEHDPQHNIIASIHLYGLWRSKDKTFSGWIPPYVVEDDIPKLVALETPVIVGEFGWTGNGTSINYNPEILVKTCFDNKMGWLFWAWHSNDDEPYYNISAQPDYKYTSNNSLSNAGKYLVNNSTYGYKKVSQRASVFPDFVTATENNALPFELSLYPNPSHSIIKISGNALTKNRFQLTDAKGNVCKEGYILNTDPQIEIGNLPAGIYYLKVFAGTEYKSFKVMKE